MVAKSMIRLACPLLTVDSPKKAIALKVVQILLGTVWVQREILEMSQIFSL